MTIPSNSQPEFVPSRNNSNYRTLVLLFDGTGDKEDDDVTNVIRVRNMLSGWKDKDHENKKQAVFYQRGIGTYHPKFKDLEIPLVSTVSRTYDQAVAWSLQHHIIEGYIWLMDKYQENDKISMFGFSRGAYTARALAAFITSLGLLPKHSAKKAQKLCKKAYRIFEETLRGPIHKERGAKIKENFTKLATLGADNGTRKVNIDFIGCWDTVNSVGLIRPIKLPFTARNDRVRAFRHALALDEHRVRFKPNMWGRPSKTGVLITDVEEVWFSGCHCDVGGGSVRNDIRPNLSHIPLRWMIRECFKTNTEILFNVDALRIIGLDLDPVTYQPLPRSMSTFKGLPGAKVLVEQHPGIPSRFGSCLHRLIPGTASPAQPVGDISLPDVNEDELDALDALAPMYDQLLMKPERWRVMEEYWLLAEQFQKDAKPGEPLFKEVRERHRGRGRAIIVPEGDAGRHGTFKVHKSVQLRMAAESEYKNKELAPKYTPVALVLDSSIKKGEPNWQKRRPLVESQELIQWVL